MYNVLVVEDEDIIRAGIVRIIKSFSLPINNIYEAYDQESAINAVLDYKPDIIVTDIMLQASNGLDSIEKVQSLINSNYKPRFIIVTGFDKFSYAKRAIFLGVDEYLLKPLNKVEFQKALIKSIDLLSKINKKNDTDFETFDIDFDAKNESNIINNATNYIIENYYRDISLESVAEIHNLSYNYFSTLFKEKVGVSYKDFVLNLRLTMAKKMLKYQHELNISEIAYAVGFYDEKYFFRVFKKHTDLTPRQYRDSVNELSEKKFY